LQQAAELHGGTWGEALHFEVQARGAKPRQHLVERWHDESAAAIGEISRGVFEPVAGVEFLELVQGQLIHGAVAVGGAINGFVVNDNDDSVGGDAEVHFQHIDAERRGLFKGVQGVLRPESAPTSVGDCPGTGGVEEAMIVKDLERMHEGEVEVEDRQDEEDPEGPPEKAHERIVP